MNCEEALELLSGHIDGANTPEEEARLQAHLASCPACRAVLSAYEDLDGSLSALKAEPPAELVQGVMDTIRQEPAQSSKIRRFPVRGVAATAVAAALLLVIGTTYLPELNRGQDADPASPDAVSYVADTPADDTAALSKALPADTEVADAVPDTIPVEDAVVSNDESAQTAPQPNAMTATATSPDTAATSPDITADTVKDPAPNVMTVTPSMVTTDTLSDAVQAAFPDGQAIPTLLVELTDNPEKPAAANIVELSQLTAESTAAEQIVFYECTAATVRQIVAAYETIYEFITPAQLDTAADGDACGLLVIQP